MKLLHFGSSSLGLPIFGFEFGNKHEQAPHIFILGGVHGDEVEGIALAQALISKVTTHPITNLKLTIVPEFNIEGFLLKTRQNHKGVDLNRNLPTKDWTPEFKKIRHYPGSSAASEPENQALIKFINSNKIDFIITLHSWKPLLNTNGDCSLIVNELTKKIDYTVTKDIGYPTPGSLGTFTGLERKIPTLTYEIQKGLDLEEVLSTHLDPLYQSLKHYSHLHLQP